MQRYSLPLSISRNTFEYIRKAWRLSTELLRVMLSTLPIATEFSIYGDTGQSPRGIKRQKSPAYYVTGLMVRDSRSRDWNHWPTIQ